MIMVIGDNLPANIFFFNQVAISVLLLNSKGVFSCKLPLLVVICVYLDWDYQSMGTYRDQWPSICK